MIGYMLKMKWKTPYLRRLRSVNTQWKAAIDSLDINYFDFSSCCQGKVQPCNSHRLRLFRKGNLIHHNLKAYGKHSRGVGWPAPPHSPPKRCDSTNQKQAQTLSVWETPLIADTSTTICTRPTFRVAPLFPNLDCNLCPTLTAH